MIKKIIPSIQKCLTDLSFRQKLENIKQSLQEIENIRIIPAVLDSILDFLLLFNNVNQPLRTVFHH